MTETGDYETMNGAEPTVGTGKLCDTDTTPPCPLAAFYVARNELIYQLAGPCPSKERRRRISARVDEYLVTTLRGVLVLNRATEQPPVQCEPDSEIEARIEIVETMVK